MRDESHTRAAMAQQRVLLALMRLNPGMDDASIAALTDAALASGAARSYILGAESGFAVSDALAHSADSEVGRLIHSHHAKGVDRAKSQPDHSAATAGMTPLQMMHYARSRGLK